MAWSVVDSGGFGTASNTTATFTPNVTVNADDLMVLQVDCNPATYVPGTPTGWTAGPVSNVSASMRTFAFWKWAAGTENGNAQAWTSSQWATSVNKAIGWIIIRGVDKTMWNAMSDADRFEQVSTLSSATESVPTQTTDTSKKFGHVSMWNERSSTPTAAGTITVPSGYTMTSDMTWRTGAGACNATVAWPTSLPEETDGSVGSGSWGNEAAGGVTVLTVAFPTGAATTTVAGGVSGITVSALAGTVSAGGSASVSGGVSSVTVTAPKGVPGPVSSDVVSSISYPAIAAHRGGMGVKPQNTMTAFTYAAALSANVALEMDVQVNASGSLVLWHDSTVDAVGVNSSGTPQTGTVVSKTDTQWDALCVTWPAGFTGPPPAPAAYWRNIVETYRNSGRVLMPEIKATAAGAPLVASIVANGMQGQCIVQSFDASDLTQVVAAGIDAILLDNTPDYSAMVAAGIGHVGIDYTVVTGTQVTDAHAVGIKVWCYTPNTVAARDSLLAIGVDGFITNKPATLLPNFVDGETVAITVTALAGSVATGATVAGGVSAVTVTALAGAVTVAPTVTAAPAAITTTALAGVVGAGVTVAGGTPDLAVAALAGTVDARRAADITATPAEITLAANSGTVLTGGAIAVAGQLTTITVTAPVGTVDAQQVATIAGGTTELTVAAHAGTVGVAPTITASPATITTTALAGTVEVVGTATIDGGICTITLTTPAGTVDAQQAATLTGQPATITLTTHAGQAVAAQEATITGLTAQMVLQARAGLVQAINGLLVTPDERTYTIRAETRTAVIAAEDRTLRAPTETRTLEVAQT